MLKQLTENVASSLVTLIAISCVMLGMAGFSNLVVSDNADIMPIMTPLLSLTTLIAGVAIMSYRWQQWLATRTLGAMLVALGIYATGWLPLQISLFLPATCIIVGLVLLLASNQPLSVRVCRWSGLLLLLFAAGLFVSLWLRGYTTSWATNPIAVTAAMVIMLLVGSAFTLLPRALEQRTQINVTGSLVAAVIVTATIVIWTVLSNEHIDNIKSRGALNLQKSSEAISSRLDIQNKALVRLVSRWNLDAEDSWEPLIEVDTTTYLNDFELIQAMMLYQQQEFDNPLLTKATAPAELLIADIDSIKTWRQQQFKQQGAVVVEDSLATNEPRFILVFPINNPHYPARQLLVVLNLKKLLSVSKISYLDYFDTYLKLSDDYFLPINSQAFAPLSKHELAKKHFFQLSTSLPVFGEQPMTFHAVLNEPGIFWQNAAINQAVLLVGLLLAALFLATFDINRRLNRERKKLFTVAQFDSVTQLIRRDVLEQRMTEYLQKSPHLSCCVLFIDLDGFKAINDNLGLRIGNKLLHSVARRLQQNQQDNLQIARFSGDEFIVFAPDTDLQKGRELAKTFLRQIREKFDFYELDLYLTASIGLSVSKFHSTDAELLIQNADVAMSHAKRSGGNTFEVFADKMAIQYKHELHLRNKLQKAIEQREFEVYYQPYVSARGQRIIGAEALVRWPQPDGSFISPAEFIPIAEQTGQIVPLSKLIMRAAIADLAKWQVGKNFTLSINLSVKQFQRENIIGTVSELAQEYQVPLQQLQFELTESVMVEDAQKVFRELAELRTIGCRVAIDDFGTGFSSLSYLSRLPIDTLKIDREFSQSIFTDPASPTICKAITDMAHGLNKMVIVEGIETPEQADFFMRQGCMGLQGFLFYKPMPFDEFYKTLAAETTQHE